ncbi:MAG: ACT domain-containing protein [Chlamydiae bacterium]|nr:ACT domain-containing protein [Chlamydiota bacterium]
MFILSILPIGLAVVRLPASSEFPKWVLEGEFFSITKTSDEMSIVSVEDIVPQGVQAEKGWGCFKVEGPLDLAQTGVLAALTAPLAAAEITVFAISTFDTDYLLVKRENLAKAITALSSICKIL